MIFILILQLLFALSFLILRKIGIYGAPFFTAGVRLIFAGNALLIVQFIQSNKEFYKVKEQWKIFLVASILNTYITNAFGQYGIQYLPCCIVSFIYNLAPFITAAFSYLFFKEKIKYKKMLTLVIGLFGFLPLFLSNPITYASCY